jgi:hypothetical protein
MAAAAERGRSIAWALHNMNPNSINVRYGELEDVIGNARRHDGIAIVPARVQLTGSMLTNGSCLEEYIAAHALAADIRALIHPGKDAPWVCGRVQRVFSLPQVPEEDRAEKSCMGFGFLAALPEGGALVGIPFECTDHYGRPRFACFGGDVAHSLSPRGTRQSRHPARFARAGGGGSYARRQETVRIRTRSLSRSERSRAPT